MNLPYKIELELTTIEGNTVELSDRELVRKLVEGFNDLIDYLANPKEQL